MALAKRNQGPDLDLLLLSFPSPCFTKDQTSTVAAVVPLASFSHPYVCPLVDGVGTGKENPQLHGPHANTYRYGKLSTTTAQNGINAADGSSERNCGTNPALSTVSRKVAILVRDG